MKIQGNKKKRFVNQLSIESLLHSLLKKAKKEKDDINITNLERLLSEYNKGERQIKQASIMKVDGDIDDDEEDIGIDTVVLSRRFNLNAKQVKFVKAYLITNNGLKSAQLAGYASKSYGSLGVAGNQILNSNNVREALEWCYRKLEERTQVTPEWVIIRLKEIVERCMQAKQVLDKLGRPTGIYTFDSSGSNRALELLAKHLGMFVERLDLTVNRNKLTLTQEKEFAEMTSELATQKYLELIKAVEVNVLESNLVREQLSLKSEDKKSKFRRKEQ